MELISPLLNIGGAGVGAGIVLAAFLVYQRLTHNGNGISEKICTARRETIAVSLRSIDNRLKEISADVRETKADIKQLARG